MPKLVETKQVFNDNLNRVSGMPFGLINVEFRDKIVSNYTHFCKANLWSGDAISVLRQ